MSELNDILNAFELTLGLERELGVRVLDFDRSLLSSPKIAAPPKAVAKTPPLPEKKTQRVQPLEPAKVNVPAVKETFNATEIAGLGKSDSPDFLFAVEISSNAEAEDLFRKMVAAMGYPTLESVYVLRLPPLLQRDTVSGDTEKRIEELVSSVNPKAIVLFGSSVAPYFFPGKIMRKGLAMFAGIPVMVTNSPYRILTSNTPSNAVKRETWNALKLILSRIGKTPPGAAK
jgi:hypothetical protein